MEKQIKSFEDLQKIAIEHGYTVDTFATHAPNFYEDAVLFVAVGEKRVDFDNRNSHRVLETWDVSYSINRNPAGKNKWARALNAAYQYIIENPAPTADELDAERERIRLANKRTYNKNYRAEQKRQQENIITL